MFKYVRRRRRYVAEVSLTPETVTNQPLGRLRVTLLSLGVPSLGRAMVGVEGGGKFGERKTDGLEINVAF